MRLLFWEGYWRRGRASSASAAALAGLAAAAPAAAAGLDVSVTIKPIHALVAQVMEGVGTPHLVVSGTASPHTFSLRPSEARALHASNVFFRVSESVEPFTARLVAALPESVHVVTLAEAPGVELLDRRTGDTFEAHSHDAEMHGDAPHDDDEHHDQADHHEDEEEHEGHAGRDGHVWLSPSNARAMVRAIAKTLAEADPGSAARLESNATAVIARLDALEAEVRTELAPVRGKPFVVFHDAYQYFERSFGVEALGAITVSPEVQPSAKRLSEIRAKIVSLGAACVFAEPTFSPSLVAAVIEGTAARPGTLDPEATQIEPGPGAYESLMRNLASGLVSCLSQP